MYTIQPTPSRTLHSDYAQWKHIFAVWRDTHSPEALLMLRKLRAGAWTLRLKGGITFKMWHPTVQNQLVLLDTAERFSTDIICHGTCPDDGYCIQIAFNAAPPYTMKSVMCDEVAIGHSTTVALIELGRVWNVIVNVSRTNEDLLEKCLRGGVREHQWDWYVERMSAWRRAHGVDDAPIHCPQIPLSVQRAINTPAFYLKTFSPRSEGSVVAPNILQFIDGTSNGVHPQS